MKKVYTAIIMLICLAVASAQEGRSPQKPNPTVEKTQPVEKTQETVIVDLSSFLRDRFQPVEDLTGQALKDKEGRCAVHHHELKEVRVPIIYGLIPASIFPTEIAKKLFPNSAKQIEGGCMVMPAKEAKVLQCEKCLAAKSLWFKENMKGASANQHSGI